MLCRIANNRLPMMLTQAKNMLLFVEAWTLGDKYLLPQPQNAVMTDLITQFEKYTLLFDSDLVNSLLRATSVDTGLR